MSAYLKAAEKVHNGGGLSCIRLQNETENAGSSSWGNEVKLYKEWFGDLGFGGLDSPGFQVFGWDFGDTEEEKTENRTLALLFMHWIAEDLKDAP